MKTLFTLLFTVITLSSTFSQIFDYYGPAPFDQILEQSFNKAWTPSAVSSVDNLDRVVLLDAETKNKVVSINSSDLTQIDLVSLDDLHGTTSTYGSMLRGIFQLVDLAMHEENDAGGGSGTYTPLTGEYQLKPLLHSYYALNSSDLSKANITDAGTYFIEDQAEDGYLLLSFSGAPASVIVSAVSQWKWNSSTQGFEENDSWTTQWLMINNTELVWTSTEGNATAFYLANADELISLEIADGSDFNPETITFQTNATAEIPDNIDNMEDSKLVEELPLKIGSDYSGQLGTSSSAADAATAMLDEIETTVTENGSTLRYPKAFYLAMRENMLSQTVASSDIYGAILGSNTVPHVYFTNASDDNGVPHPFMVIAAFATSTRPNLLLDVHRPPGASGGPGYGQSQVTRNGKIGDFLVRIPLKDYGLVSSLLENDLSANGDLASDFDDTNGATTEKTVYNYTSLASCGMAVDGVTIYPGQNNNLRFAVEDGEVTSSGIHVGGGLELHYHADGHAFNGNGINLYNLADYVGKDHPPVIGIGHDGVALFGRYESGYSDMAGYNTSLDEFGGHDHGDGFGYHYHAHSENVQSDKGTNFEEHFLMVGAWKGNINNIPGFEDGKLNQFDDESIARYVGADYTPSAPGETLSSIDLTPILVYPNPGTGIFRIDLKADALLKVYALDGGLKKTIKVSADNTIFSLEDLKAGEYIIRAYNENGAFSSRVILEK